MRKKRKNYETYFKKSSCSESTLSSSELSLLTSCQTEANVEGSTSLSDSLQKSKILLHEELYKLFASISPKTNY